jgi:hypothetical protein
VTTSTGGVLSFKSAARTDGANVVGISPTKNLYWFRSFFGRKFLLANITGHRVSFTLLMPMRAESIFGALK